jgi:hypothetical protein
MVSVELPPADTLTGEGVLQISAAGHAETPRVTLPEKPFSPATEIVTGEELPFAMLTVEGLAEIEKSGADTQERAHFPP